MEHLLEVKNLSVSIEGSLGEVQAVRDVSFSLKKGEVLAIVGESGCGKSVLCKSIMKLLPPSAKIKEGSIHVNGQDITCYREKEMQKLRGKVFSMIFQDPMTSLMYSIRITVNSIRNDGTTRKDPGNGGKPRKIKGFSELMKRGGTRIDTFFEKRAHFSEQKEKLSTLSTKRAGKPHKQRVPGSFLNWNE